jgi:hypothetical protein
MKHILPLVILCLFLSPVMAQYSTTISYSLSAPGGDMANNIKPLHSAKLNVGRQLTGCLSRIQVGAEFGIGTYAQITKKQTFVFDDGTTTVTNVRYGSNVFQANAFTRIDVLQKGKIIPYIKGNAGLARFYSNVTVEDPKDIDGCQPLEKKSLIKDNVLALGYGAGVRVDMQSFCSKMNRGDEFIDFSVTRVSGGNVNYINTRRLRDHYHNEPNNDPKSQPLVQRFINASTQRIHEHQVAELYTSALQMLEFRIGYTVKF